MVGQNMLTGGGGGSTGYDSSSWEDDSGTSTESSTGTGSSTLTTLTSGSSGTSSSNTDTSSSGSSWQGSGGSSDTSSSEDDSEPPTIDDGPTVDSEPESEPIDFSLSFEDGGVRSLLDDWGDSADDSDGTNDNDDNDMSDTEYTTMMDDETGGLNDPNEETVGWSSPEDRDWGLDDTVLLDDDEDMPMGHFDAIEDEIDEQWAEIEDNLAAQEETMNEVAADRQETIQNRLEALTADLSLPDNLGGSTDSGGLSPTALVMILTVAGGAGLVAVMG